MIASIGKISPSVSFMEGDYNRGRGSRGDGEKASKPTTSETRDGRVNNSTRLHSGASSRASRPDGFSSSMARSSNRAPLPRSPARRSRSPYRASHNKRRMSPRSRSRSRSFSRSPSVSSRRGLNDRLRSRSPSHDDDARPGDKRPRSSNHYHPSSHSDPRRFKVHYEKEKDSLHRGLGRNDKESQNRYPRDDDRVPRNGDDLPTRNSRRAENHRGRSRSPYRRDDAARKQSHAGAKLNQASHMTSSIDSNSSQSAHNQNGEKDRNQTPSRKVPPPRYVKFQQIFANAY